MIDISEYPEVIRMVNAALSKGATVEIKPEKTGIAVSEVARHFKDKVFFTPTAV